MQKSHAALALAAASVIVLAGCSSAPGAADDGKLRVVASTNVYGALAAEVGGDRVDVTSLIDSAEKDPHSYEATARDRLAVQQADLVIENGGGYDGFIEELRDGSDAVVITAAEFSHDFPGSEDGHDHAEEHAHADDEHAHADDEHAHAEEEGDHAGHDHIEGFNEHVWFDPHTIIHVVEQVAADLGEADPEGKDGYTANAEKLISELEGIESELDELHTALEGTPVFMTEPLPGYLAAAAGLDDATPEGFSSAVEEGNDVAPATLLAALQLIEDGGVEAVLTNAQTGGAETDKVEDAAEAAGIPVVTFSELLEADQSYAEWMHDAIQSLADALEK
ncbi:metal ABC transporter solute-binding protein, Zn/Mn family [Microbacterium sp.]|uniref:metal ABC transporter solute-binding protein, Zn/Mn family n=1 Tax=Microbacterium sp. TaxID=51671 RepID=UPI002810E94A|nr:zinc ABC transporter substrate-binding protein [Microbacterium sp.]